MLPLRLRVENFCSFRESTTIDFEGVDYFALVGPTGAGKSTVIDAMCFALYGTVPRWDDERRVGWALPPSASRGTVALVFECGGSRYGVVRVLARGARGVVQTKEARLEELEPSADGSLEELLEASVRRIAEGEGVTAAVSALTCLEYRYFTQCVVLPQGRFAEFLHARPRDRQDLLVRLLDASVYERVQARAGEERRVAETRAQAAREQLAELTDADEAAENEAAERLGLMERLAHEVTEATDELTAREEALRSAKRDLDAAQGRGAALAGLAMPEEVPVLAAEVAGAEEDAATLAERLGEAGRRLDEAEVRLEAAGDKAGAVAALQAHRTAAELRRRLADQDVEIERAREREERLAAEVVGRHEQLEEAERLLRHVRDTHAAVDLASRLAVGEPCPVCLRVVEEQPSHPAPEDLAAAEARLDGTRDRWRDADEQHRDARTDRHGKVQVRAQLAGRLDELRSTLEAHPDQAALERQLTEIGAAETARKEAQRRARTARKAHEGAARHAATLRQRTEKAWNDLDVARDTVAALAPPVLPRDDPSHAWGTLLAWRDRAAAGLERSMREGEQAVASARTQRDRLRDRLVARLGEHDITAAEPTPTGFAVAAGAGLTRVREHLDRVRENRARAENLRGRAEEDEKAAAVAKELALLLRADHFERWLCEEALALLVEAASDTLRELSGGQYELTLGDPGVIEVVDYAEAGMSRDVRTLSGGETFQAALALALALSERVAGMAAAAARSLDSVFLDEGFGTLDPETLDTVAATLERLAAGGERMVGLVTHVPALAERVPVRFQVRRDDHGSHVEKVVA